MSTTLDIKIKIKNESIIYLSHWFINRTEITETKYYLRYKLGFNFTIFIVFFCQILMGIMKK